MSAKPDLVSNWVPDALLLEIGDALHNSVVAERGEEIARFSCFFYAWAGASILRIITGDFGWEAHVGRGVFSCGENGVKTVRFDDYEDYDERHWFTRRGNEVVDFTPLSRCEQIIHCSFSDIYYSENTDDDLDLDAARATLARHRLIIFGEPLYDRDYRTSIKFRDPGYMKAYHDIQARALASLRPPESPARRLLNYFTGML